MIVPINPKTDAAMKNLGGVSTRLRHGWISAYHLRPKMSDNRPTNVKPIANPAVQEMPTHMMSGEGPMAALISVSVLAGNTQPRYPDIWARHVAFALLLGSQQTPSVTDLR
jgi:hypothetical protein